MATETTYTALRQNLSSVLDQVTQDREIVMIRRRGVEDVALVPAGELASLMETAHLLRSPANARRLRAALASVRKGQGRPSTVPQLRRKLGLER